MDVIQKTQGVDVNVVQPRDRRQGLAALHDMFVRLALRRSLDGLRRWNRRGHGGRCPQRLVTRTTARQEPWRGALQSAENTLGHASLKCPVAQFVRGMAKSIFSGL